MSDHLPQEVVVEILIRCEVATLLRCRCISKQWRATIDDPEFIRHHMDYSLTNYSLYIKEDALYKSDRGLQKWQAFQAYCHPLHSCNFLPRFDNAFFVGSCHGLLCLIDKYSKAVFIFNPSTRLQLCISGTLPDEFFTNWLSLYAYGFGYDDITDDYKIVGLISSQNKILIYHVKTRQTTEVKSTYFPKNEDYGVLAGGVLHWLVCRFDDSATGKRVIVLSFDLRTDQLMEVPQPEYSAIGCNLTCLCLLGTRLCLCAGDGVDHTVWVMKEYGVKESWTKLLSIPYANANIMDLHTTLVRPWSFSKNGCQVLLELRHDLTINVVWYDIEKKIIVNYFSESFDWNDFDYMVCLRCLTPLPSIQ